MLPPFLPIDFDEAGVYLKSHTPEQMVSDSRSWPCDLTDILCVADTISTFLKADDHAIALYYEGLRRLKEYPEQASPDTDIAAAYASLGVLLSKHSRSEEAVNAFTNALRAGGTNPLIKFFLAGNLHSTGRFAEAITVLDQMLQLPYEQLVQWLSTEQINYAQGLRSFLHRQ